MGSNGERCRSDGRNAVRSAFPGVCVYTIIDPEYRSLFTAVPIAHPPTPCLNQTPPTIPPSRTHPLSFQPSPSMILSRTIGQARLILGLAPDGSYLALIGVGVVTQVLN